MKQGIFLAFFSLGISATVFAQTPVTADFWMHRYTVHDYGAIWHVDLQVKDGARARKKIVAAIKKKGGAPTEPLSHFPVDSGYQHQQIAFSIPMDKADKMLADLRGVGTVHGLTQRQDPQPSLPEEALIKLKALEEETVSGRAMLAQLPSSAAAVNEIIAHLRAAREAQKTAASRILFNLAVEEAAQRKK